MATETRHMTTNEMIANCDEVADYFESVAPENFPVYPAAEYWLRCAVQRAAVTGCRDHDRIGALIADARAAGSTWERIAELLETTPEAAAARYGSA